MLHDVSGLEFEVRGDGRVYICNIHTDGLQQEDLFQSAIYTRGGPLWQKVCHVLARARQSHFSRSVLARGSVPIVPHPSAVLRTSRDLTFLISRVSPLFCLSQVRIPFCDFLLTSLGYVQNEQSHMDLTAVKTVGILLADEVDGPFNLDIRSIKVSCYFPFGILKRTRHMLRLRYFPSLSTQEHVSCVTNGIYSLPECSSAYVTMYSHNLYTTPF